ncbi:hypothetical protein B0T17DRAFT_319885 [Bombardia bombarda]|uniref:Uncharacterized protein n=1 Tax=Bombardia bombarda TaxID=252184 RepID=A0AA39WMI6_9PEZI|nr:hypothetical protein B0T17DRAFT_319885 [Bombardia bombarda]
MADRTQAYKVFLIRSNRLMRRVYPGPTRSLLLHQTILILTILRLLAHPLFSVTRSSFTVVTTSTTYTIITTPVYIQLSISTAGLGWILGFLTNVFQDPVKVDPGLSWFAIGFC